MSNINAANITGAECAYIRSVLDEGKFELTAAYEHGIFNSSQFYENFKSLSEKFAETGLQYGADKFKDLFDVTSAARLAAKWQTNDAVLKMAEIWNYIGICIDRLNFYEILNDMKENTD